MKVIIVDNFARETIADRLFCEGVTPRQADAICNTMNAARYRDDSAWYVPRADDYVLWRGMAEFV